MFEHFDSLAMGVTAGRIFSREQQIADRAVVVAAFFTVQREFRRQLRFDG